MSAPIIVDQEAQAGQWVHLGNYFFGAFGGQYIVLDNVTGETTNSREVLFDAALFVPTP